MKTVITSETICSQCGVNLHSKAMHFICYSSQSPCKYGHEPSGVATVGEDMKSVINSGIMYKGKRYNVKNISLKKAKKLSYPDGGGVWKIGGRLMRVHCDEYHMHRFECLTHL